MKRLLFILLAVSCSWQALGCIMHTPKNTMIEWFDKEVQEGKQAHLLANLATVTPASKPTSRMVNFFWDDQGNLAFYTHKNTQKVGHLAANPNASMNVWLPTLRKQVTVNGQVSHIDQKMVAETWTKMPRWMQLRFVSSDHQSAFMRPDLLKKALKAAEEKYPDEVPMPDSFVGFSLAPEQIVFFQSNMPAHATKHIANLENQQWKVSLYQP